MNMIPNIIPWDQVEIGKEYLYEENYFFQGRVKILERLPERNHGYVEYKVKIVDGNPAKYNGEEWTLGKTIEKKYAAYTNDMNFLSLDSAFSYSGVLE